MFLQDHEGIMAEFESPRCNPGVTSLRVPVASTGGHVARMSSYLTYFLKYIYCWYIWFRVQGTLSCFRQSLQTL